MVHTIKAVNKENLIRIIHFEMDKNGFNCDLNFIDVSAVTDMTALFICSSFNGDISKWDVSNVIHMEKMFYLSKFDGEISNWNVSKVTNMAAMFKNSKFTQNLANWKPTELMFGVSCFLNCSAPIPYWMNFENVEQRKKAILAYDLHKQLSSELLQTIEQNKKTKI